MDSPNEEIKIPVSRVRELVKEAVANRDKEVVEYLNRLKGKNSLYGYQTAIIDVIEFINP